MNTQIYREASEWLVEFRTDEVDRAMRRRFEMWLGRSPEHVCAYLELTAVWEDSSLLDAGRELDIDSLIARSRSDADVVDLLSERRAAPASATLGTSRPRLYALAASILIGLGGGLGFWYWSAYQRGNYATAVGQQRTLTLPDGSTVELNADTHIRERYNARQRTVELIAGQALFRVAKNPRRPFVVISGAAAVRAVGTQFDVYRKDSGTVVTVIEGRVAVSSKNTASRSIDTPARSREILLEPGEQVSITPRAASIPAVVNLSLATAWTQQKLIFESASLTDVAKEFNRFNARKLVVAPAGLEDFRVNGTFPALDPNSLSRFIDFLREQPGVALDESAERIVVAKYR